MFKFIEYDKRFLFRVIADLIIIASVCFLSVNPARMVGFYFADIFLMVFSFAVYDMISERFFSITGLLLGTLLCILMASYYMFIVDIPEHLDFAGSVEYVKTLFYPYYDIAAFMSSLLLLTINDLRKWLTFDSAFAKPIFGKHLLVNLLMIPGLMVVSNIALALIPNKALALVISLIVVRHFLEYMRNNYFKQAAHLQTVMVKTKNGYFNKSYFEQYIGKQVVLSPFPKKMNPDGDRLTAIIGKELITVENDFYYLVSVVINDGEAESYLLSPKQTGKTENDSKRPFAGLIKVLDDDQPLDKHLKPEQTDFVYWVEVSG